MISTLITLSIQVVLAIITLVVLLIVSKLVASSVKRKIINNALSENDEYVQKLANLAHDIVMGLMTMFSLLIGFNIVGLNLEFLIGGISFAMWFALKEILWNMVAWLMILTNQKIKIGDTVEFPGLGYFGKISEITIRYTVVKCFDNRRAIIPNTMMVETPLKTFSSEQIIKWDVTISIGLKEDVYRVSQLIKEFVASKSYIVNPQDVQVVVSTFGSSSIDLQVYFFFSPHGKVGGIQIKSNLRKELLQLFDANNIEFPYDHQVWTVDTSDKNLISWLLYATDKIH